MQAHSSFIWDLSSGAKGPPPETDLRSEDPTRPTVGDLVQPGQLVRTSYGTGPFRVETVTPREIYPGFTAWSLVLSGMTGGFVDKSREYSINEVVVEWEGDAARLRMLFRANDDEVILIGGAAYSVSRKGQLSLF